MSPTETYHDPPASALFDAAEARQDDRREGGQFPVVGIGASAGGLEAFTQLLAHLPDGTGMAFVLIQHLDPAHESQLADLLSKATRLPVVEVTDGLAVSPDHVYVIPPNTNMTIVQGVLHLSPRGEARTQHLPLDIFFRSLAEDRQSRAIGVILSGTGSDGSLGLAEIKAVGGLTFAQDEKSARYPAMPLNAVNGGSIDFVLPPEEIALELARIGQHSYLAPPGIAESEPEAESAFQDIIAQLRSSTQVDFGHYRDTTLRRRIARRMAIHRTEALAQYAQLLKQSPSEVEALYQDILINVTSFFREPEVFEALKSTVFPEMVKNKSPEMPIRIWVPGCSAGQEVYSLAMALLEFLDDKPMRPPIQLFGTDINDAVSVERARQGFYPHSIESEVSPGRLRRFFIREDGGYRIGKSIRDMCVFARQNVAADPPFSRLDLISCRNVLIYLSGPLHKRIIPTFHYALNPGGFLLLGASESVGRFIDLFSPADPRHNVYSKISTLTRTYPHFAAQDHPAKPPAGGEMAGERPANVVDMQKEADRVLLGRYAPAGVLVNEDFEILQFRGRTGPYLEPAPGEASLNLLKMARGNLFLELRGALEEARKNDAVACRPGVRLYDEHETREVGLHVLPIRPHGSVQRCFLVLFEEAGEPAKPGPGAASAGLAAPPDDGEIEHLRQELAAAKEYLQAIIEQQNAANEELKSANEEVLSSNEELQSTNEELQTAKEELQSTNEELRTVNDELHNRNLEVSQVNDDLTNTLASVKIPIVMLGRDLRIRRFTPAGGGVLNLIPTDTGRPLTDIRPAFDIPDLEKMLLEVIATVAVQEREIRDRNGHWYLLRMHPYRTADDRIDGVVLVLLDITGPKQAEDALKFLARCGAAPGEDFFQSLARYLAQALGMDYVCIDRLHEDLLTARTVAVFFEGKFEDNAAYTLKDTPCGDVVKKAICHFPRGVRHLFPKDAALQEMSAESYVGTILWSSQGQPIGLIAVIGRQPLADPKPATSILQMVAVRAAGELERRQAEEALRESEERFRSLAANAQDIIFRYEYLPSPHYAYISPAVTALTGYTPEEFYADPDIVFKLVHDDDRDMFAAMLRGETPPPMVLGVRLVHKAGKTVWTEQRCVLRHDDAGRLLAVEGVTRDVTERELADMQLREAKEAAEVADRAKDQFLAVLSHELRTPLTPVLAAASMLQADPRLDEDQRESLEMIRRNAELEARLIDDLLDVTRIARGKVELDRRPVDLSTIIHRAVEVCEPDIEARRLRFGLDIEAPPHLVEVDAGRMQQVFWNLLKNAIKFTPHGGSVGVRCWREDGQVLTEINDTGVGIDPAVLPHLFKPFEQGGAQTTRQFGGLGLGLTISKALVEMHGGAIEVRSLGRNKGATFTVRLPICAAPPAGAESGFPAGEPQPAPVKRRLQILLVEDHGDSARILRRILMRYGHEVQTAGDMASALEIAGHRHFDLLISDLGLPDGSGLDLIRVIRARGLALPAIALSGYGQEEDIAGSKAAGFSEHLVKPVDFAHFRQVIDRYAIAGQPGRI